MIRLFKHYVPYAVLFLGFIDFFLLITISDLAWLFRAAQIGIEPGLFAGRFALVALVSAFTLTAMLAVGVYASDALLSLRLAAARLLVAFSFSVLGLAVIDFVVPGEPVWRSILLYTLALAFPVLLVARLILATVLGTSAFRRSVMILGAGQRAQRVVDLGMRAGASFEVVGVVSMGAVEPAVEGAIPRSEIADLATYVGSLGTSEVVLALEERRNSLPLKDLLRIKTQGAHVNDFSSFLERETGRVDLNTLNPSWLIFSDGFSASRAVAGVLKRIFDVVASSLLLVLSLPIVLVFAILVKLDSPGPAFFRQTRVGLYGQTFTLVKLRSMRTDAEKDGAKWAEKADPRATRIGSLIRKLRIDELPQVWNVLKGEMSFVGPRPEVPRFVSELEQELPYYAERHVVKPGITGWAQINYPYGASIEDARHKLEYDLYYAKNYTPFLDILILLQTIRVILWPDGAR